MTELQATVEFSVELHKFYNVDLFQRGFYQVRVGFKLSPKLSAKIEVNLGRSAKLDQAYPPCILNGNAVSKTFQILYRNEEVSLEDVAIFRVHVLVESHKIEETLERAEMCLVVELWFTEQGSPEGMACVSGRTLQLHFAPSQGLHYSLPVLFDYFHLAAVTITVHTTLVALHQPCINTPRSGKPLFGNSNRLLPRHATAADTLFFSNVNSKKCVGSGSRILHARHVHREVCRILLSTYETLAKNLQEYMKLLPAWQQLKLDTNHHLKRLQNLSEFAKACHVSITDSPLSRTDESMKTLEGEEDFISIANSDIAQLCAENILLWQQFLETLTCKEPVHQHLAKIHHQLRVKRFAEAFFVMDNPRQSAAGCYDANYQSYLAVAESVRRSRYLASLPPLPITCVELDGDLTTLPIIFEDQYQDVAEFARRRSGGNKKSTDPESLLPVLPQKSLTSDECSCGIAAILQSRSLKSNLLSSPTPQLSLSMFGLGKNKLDVDGIVKGTLTIRPSVSSHTFPRGPSARQSRSLDQLRISSSAVQRSVSSLAPTLVGQSGVSQDSLILAFLAGERGLRHSPSSLSMPAFDMKDGGLDYSLLRHNSESMPNLPPASNGFFTSPSLSGQLNDQLLISPPPDLSGSPISSSVTDSVTSEQSGWVSNSSRRSSSTSSPALSMDARPDYSTLRTGNKPLPPLDGDNLRSRLEQLAVMIGSPKRLERSCDELHLPPPKQFRDAPPPPQAFRDPPRLRSVDNLLGRESSRRREFEDRDRRVRRRRQLRRNKPTSDEGFDELELQRDSDTSTVESVPVRDMFRTRHPFRGYLFKEDVETLKRTYETDAEKNIATSVINTNSVITKEMSRTFSDEDEEERKRKKKEVEMEKHVDCACYEETRPQDATITFIKAKEEFKRHINFTGVIYSDFPTQASTLPYFHISDEYRIFSPEGLHLIVCVHGLDGNSADLRLIKTYLELGLPGANLEFLMSERNQGDTFSDFETMTEKLVSEILYHIEASATTPTKISFIGHSLGTVIIRSALARPQLKHLLPFLHTFLSLSGPHLGTLYNNSGLVNMGMWFIQKWKKSGSLLQLSLRDTADIRRSFLYRLSQKSNLQHFRHVLLCGSSQDRYVPMHSARIELCKAAIKDTSSQGAVYREMVHNIMYPIISSTHSTIVRYDIHHALPNTANSIIGRAAHIAVLDSELFIEKFLVVAGLKYFR